MGRDAEGAGMRISWHGAEAKPEPRSPLAVHIGRQIHRVRQKKQLPLRALAEKSGISTTFLCELENGKRQPSAETLVKLSAATGKPFGYWVQGFDLGSVQ